MFYSISYELTRGEQKWLNQNLRYTKTKKENGDGDLEHPTAR